MKGRIERQSQYVRHAFFAARPFRDLDDVNAPVRRWRDDIAHGRPDPDQPHHRVADVWAEERLRLLPLPAHPLETDLVRAVRFGKTPISPDRRSRRTSAASRARRQGRGGLRFARQPVRVGAGSTDRSGRCRGVPMQSCSGLGGESGPARTGGVSRSCDGFDGQGLGGGTGNRTRRGGRLEVSDAFPLQVVDFRPHLLGVPRFPVVALAAGARTSL